MKVLTTSFLILFLIHTSFAQVNESADSQYAWKGKKTDYQQGYVVLKSKKKLDGSIQLHGSPGHVSEIRLMQGEKELKFPPAALAAYGLSSKEIESDSKLDLFQWRSGGTVNPGKPNEKVKENTKPRSGYAITQDGTRYDGILQLHKVNGKLAKIEVKTADGKQKWEPHEIANYGIAMTIADLTKDGKKTYKAAERNFNFGKLEMSSGETKEGVIAFKTRSWVDGIGYGFKGIYYTPTTDGIIDTYKDNEVKKVFLQLAGSEKEYQYIEGTWMDASALDNMEARDLTKTFQPGTITLASSGEVRKGQVMQSKPSGAKFYSVSIRFKDESGEITEYKATDVKRFEQNIQGANRTFQAIKDRYVEREYSGTVMQFMRNPYPTHVNAMASGMAGIATQVATNQVAAKTAEKQLQKDTGVSKEQIKEANIDSIIANSTTEELIRERDRWKAIEARSSGAAASRAGNYAASMDLAIQGRSASQNMSIYKREWLIRNKNTGDEWVVMPNGFKDSVEPVLMGCYTYIMLDKDQQKQYRQWDNIQTTLKMLDDCYAE